MEKKTKHKTVTSKEARQKQKANLKTLVENSSGNRMRNAGRVFKYGATSFTRNIWLSIASALVMTVTLVILLFTIGANLILNSTAEAIRQKIDITIYFRPETDLETLNNMANMLKVDENVTSIQVSDAAMEYQLYLEEKQDDTELLEVLSDPTMSEIMLSTMHAVMRVKVDNPDDLNKLKNIVETTAIFQETIDPEMAPTYDENRDAIDKIISWANIAKNGGLILGAVFLVISILMIFNTIRMAIFSRREEIQMMKLVGADDSFVRGPFLVEAQICGVVSGILASSIAYTAYKFLAPSLSSNGIDISTVDAYMGTSKLVLVYLVVILVGVVIGNISARLAMRKYLK